MQECPACYNLCSLASSHGIKITTRGPDVTFSSTDCRSIPVLGTNWKRNTSVLTTLFTNMRSTMTYNEEMHIFGHLFGYI
jgi:hypothetical protein